MNAAGQPTLRTSTDQAGVPFARDLGGQVLFFRASAYDEVHRAPSTRYLASDGTLREIYIPAGPTTPISLWIQVLTNAKGEETGRRAYHAKANRIPPMRLEGGAQVYDLPASDFEPVEKSTVNGYDAQGRKDVTVEDLRSRLIRQEKYEGERRVMIQAGQERTWFDPARLDWPLYKEDLRGKRLEEYRSGIPSAMERQALAAAGITLPADLSADQVGKVANGYVRSVEGMRLDVYAKGVLQGSVRVWNGPISSKAAMAGPLIEVTKPVYGANGLATGGLVERLIVSNGRLTPLFSVR